MDIMITESALQAENEEKFNQYVLDLTRKLSIGLSVIENDRLYGKIGPVGEDIKLVKLYRWFDEKMKEAILEFNKPLPHYSFYWWEQLFVS